MPVVAVVNRKGGSGKSTLATHVAAYCAGAGQRVLLADVDRQLSTQRWLKRRSAHSLDGRVPIMGLAVEPNQVLRPPVGTMHVVIDTPGGLRGFDLARVVMYADAILMPVCNSAFDRESAADCYAELKALPRVAGGRCRVAAVGMRVDGRTRAADTLRLWAERLQLPFVGVLRETQTYVRCIDEGLTIFDLPPAKVQADLAQWQPILQWLEPTLARPNEPVPAAAKASAAAVRAAALRAPRAAPSPARAPAAGGMAQRVGRLMELLPIPRFLQRDS
jgi:chromosome partitioning protein